MAHRDWNRDGEMNRFNNYAKYPINEDLLKGNDYFSSYRRKQEEFEFKMIIYTVVMIISFIIPLFVSWEKVKKEYDITGGIIKWHF